MKKVLYFSILLSLVFSCKKTVTESVPVNNKCGTGFTSLNGFCIDNSGTNYYGHLNFYCYNDSLAFSYYKADKSLIFRYIVSKPLPAIGGQGGKDSDRGKILCPTQAPRQNTIIVMVNDSKNLENGNKDLPVTVYLEEYFDNNTKYIDSTKLILKQR
jgi:hypothetical protein